MEASRAAVAAAICDWLESERDRFVSLAKEKGVPVSIPMRETIASDITDASATYTEVSRFVSPLGAPLSMVPRSFWVAGLSDEPEPPAVLFEHYGERCDVWTLGLGGATAQVKARRLLAVTRMDYLSQLESLEQPKAVVMQEVVEGLLKLVEADHIEMVTVLPVAGLRLPGGNVSWQWASLRPLSVRRWEVSVKRCGNHDGAELEK